MPHHLSSLLRRLLLSTLAAGVILPGVGKEPVHIKSLCFPKQEGETTIEMLIGEEEVIEISLQSHEFTLPKKVPRLEQWQFGISGKDSEGRFTFTTHARVTPLASGRQLLLFIRKGPENEDGFNIIPLDPASILAKNYVILNLTQGPIAGVVGESKFRIAPGTQTVVEPVANRGQNLCFASLRYRRDEKWRPFFSSNWRLRERSRVLILIYQAQGQRSPRIHSVIDPI